MRRKKVFVINRGGHDYSDAERYGDLVFCTDGPVAKFNTSQMVRTFSEQMADSADDDYILLTSLSTMCSVACGVYAVRHGRLNLLLFKDGAYVERIVNLQPA